MHFMRRSEASAILHSHHRPYPGRVTGGSFQPEASPGFGALVFPKACGSPVLRHDQINASVGIEIGDRGAALFAMDVDARRCRREWTQLAVAVPLQQQASPAIEPGHWRRQVETILTQEKILLPVAIKVGNCHRKSRGELRLPR